MLPDPMDSRATLGLKASGWIAYHLLTEGRDSVRPDDGDRLSFEADDIVMIPRGDRHGVENGPATCTIDDKAHLADILSQGLKRWCVGGGEEVT